METISIALITVFFMFAIITWLCKPYRCPMCGDDMIDEWEEETDIAYKVCPKCGYKEQLN